MASVLDIKAGRFHTTFSDGRLETPREQRARIDLAIEQLEAQIEAQEQAEKRGAPVPKVEPARG